MSHNGPAIYKRDGSTLEAEAAQSGHVLKRLRVAVPSRKAHAGLRTNRPEPIGVSLNAD